MGVKLKRERSRHEEAYAGRGGSVIIRLRERRWRCESQTRERCKHCGEESLSRSEGDTVKE